MAEISYTQTQTSENHTLITWSQVAGVDTCQSYLVGPEYKHRIIQVGGDFGTGVVDVCGSLDDTHYGLLSDIHGNPVNAFTNSVFQLSENTLYVKPCIPVPAGQVVDIKLLLRR